MLSVETQGPNDGALYEPKLIVNSKSRGLTLLSSLKQGFGDCETFDICVAFVTESGLQVLVETLHELELRGARGRILTSTYLTFNTPDVYRKLLEYGNIETRVFQGNLHAKGYLFDCGKTNTIIVGSSNLTDKALTCNQEWNVLYRTTSGSSFVRNLRCEFERLWCDENTVPLSAGWIQRYEAQYVSTDKKAKSRATFVDGDLVSPTSDLITPNKMQERALEALDALHRKREPRALLISATGTGKTFLSAFDIQRVKPRRVLFLAHRKRILAASMKSYSRLLGDAYRFAMYQSGDDVRAASCVFAMNGAVAQHLDEFDPNEFDYIVIDEAHRVGSKGYEKIISYFKPEFYLGMTATPNRTDGYDVFAVFNHVIAFQITLQDALAENMLVPFHYFGISDLEIDDESVDDPSLFSKLTSDERVRHLTTKIEEYTVNKSSRRGLVFCNRNEEAKELSDKFNKLGYRTLAINGADSDEVRDEAISKLERGEVEYIFSVDIMNEGVDIPSLNQIIMLRRTDSSIVFVQQLGRGLRKDECKEYTLVLDFIGNYQSNFLVPVALTGDKTFNKDRLRRLVQEGDSAIPGSSTVNFDKISEARIYRAIDGGDFSSARFLKNEYQDLKRKLGRIPTLLEFDQNGSIDPLLIFQNHSLGSYHAFLTKYEKEYDVVFSSAKCGILKFISQKLSAGKRFEDLFVLRELVDKGYEGYREMQAVALQKYNAKMRKDSTSSAIGVLKGDFSSPAGFVSLLADDDGETRLTRVFADALRDEEFKRQVLEAIDFGLMRNRNLYSDSYEDTNFVLNAKYTYEEVCRLMNWNKNINGQNLGGYFYDAETNTFPVFINYDKAPDISESIQYEDRFLSNDRLIAISKNNRNLDSPEILRLREWPDNGMRTFLFMRKNKDDKGGKEFYFLGEMYPSGHYSAVTTKAGKRAVEIEYRLKSPVREDIYEFMMSDLSVGE